MDSGNLQPDLQNLLEIVRWVHPVLQPPFIQTVVAIFTVSRPWLPVLCLTFFHPHTPQKMVDIAHISGNPLGEIYQVYAPSLDLCACVLREINASVCFWFRALINSAPFSWPKDLDQLCGMNASEVAWLEEIQPPENLVVCRGQYKGPIIRRWEGFGQKGWWWGGSEVIAGVLGVNRRGSNAGMLAINTAILIVSHLIVHISCDGLAVNAHHKSCTQHNIPMIVSLL